MRSGKQVRHGHTYDVKIVTPVILSAEQYFHTHIVHIPTGVIISVVAHKKLNTTQTHSHPKCIFFHICDFIC